MQMVVLDGQTLNPGDNPWSPVEELGSVTIHDRTSPEQTVERSFDSAIILTNKVVLGAEEIDQLPNLKFIAVMATGYNVVDVAYARAKGIPVSNVPVYSTDSVAQHVMASLLSFIHRPQAHHDAIMDGAWQRSNNFSFWLSPLSELKGKTFSVVGLGRIGRATAKLAAAFGMRVVAHSRTEKDPLTTDGFQWLSLDKLFETSDVISLHCPQTSENTGFVNSSLLSKMKSNAILINTARGGLINEANLAKALNDEIIGGALLDVVSAEPINDDNPLLKAKNCLLTPHIAWTTVEARMRLMQTTADNIAAFQKGAPINLVN